MPTILIIEDDPSNRLLISLQVEDLDCAVLTAENGVRGLEACQSSRPAVVLLDLNLPALDGFGFLQKLRAAPWGAKVPVVVVTAMMLDAEQTRRLQEYAVSRVLEKGRYSEDDLLDALRPLLKAGEA